MAQTAVEWFIEQLEQKGELTESPAIRIVQINIDTSEYLDLKRQAKAMEKEQALRFGIKCQMDFIKSNKINHVEDVYNETYGTHE